MSTDENLTDPIENHGPGPANLDGILDDAREADPTVPINPTYSGSSTDAEKIYTRAVTDTGSVTVDEDTAEELELHPEVAGYVTIDDHSTVTLNIMANGEDGIKEAGSYVRLTPTAARQVAVQLLASAAVADEATEGPPGSLAE